MSEGYESFKAEIREKAEAEDCGSFQEWVDKFPGRHLWGQWDDCQSCAICGVCRRADDNNKPCRGIVRVTLRSGGENGEKT